MNTKDTFQPDSGELPPFFTRFWTNLTLTNCYRRTGRRLTLHLYLYVLLNWGLIMKLTTLALAATIAAAPFAANAFSVNPTSNVANGGSYDIGNGPYYWDASFNGNDGSGSVSFTFTNNSGSDAHLQIADGTVGQSGAGWFKGGVTASWTNGSATTIAAAKTSVGGGFAISTFLADNASDVLTLTWGDARGFKSDIDFTVAAVPLPAGVLLLGTALVGMGAFASRRKTA